MISRTTPQFRRCLTSLPPHIRESARKAYKLFSENPAHPSVRFKKVHAKKPIYAARVTQDYRALCVLVRLDMTGLIAGPSVAVWFWIGSHSDYDKTLKALN